MLQPPSFFQVMHLPSEAVEKRADYPDFDPLSPDAWEKWAYPYGQTGYGPDQEPDYTSGMLPAALMGGALGLHGAGSTELSRRKYELAAQQGKLQPLLDAKDLSLMKQMQGAPRAAVDAVRSAEHGKILQPIREMLAKTPVELGSSVQHAAGTLGGWGRMGLLGLGLPAAMYAYNRMSNG